MLQRDKCEKKISSVMKRVEQLFNDEPMTANSDKLLVVRYLQVYHNEPTLFDLLRDKSIPSFDTITRCGRRLRSLDTVVADEEVEENRKENEVAFANMFGR